MSNQRAKDTSQSKHTGCAAAIPPRCNPLISRESLLVSERRCLIPSTAVPQVRHRLGAVNAEAAVGARTVVLVEVGALVGGGAVSNTVAVLPQI
jgi:hypothetical protein